MVTDETATIGTEQPVEAYLDDRSPAEPPVARGAAPADPIEVADPVDEAEPAPVFPFRPQCKWARQVSNLRPSDYESAALTS